MSQAPESKPLPAKLAFRIATAEDAPALQTIVQDSFRHADSWTGDELGLITRYTMSADRIIEKLTKPNSTFIIASDPAWPDAASQDVGCFQVTQKSPTLARFATFAIRPEHKGRGFAGPMVKFAEDYAWETWGVRTMSLNTLSTRTALLAWYQRCGYRETGVKEPFPPVNFGVSAEELGTIKDLYFIVMEKQL